MERRTILKWIWVASLFLAGMLLNAAGFGGEPFFGFKSVGNWMLYVAAISICVITIQSFKNKKRMVDERMLFVANKANRIVFMVMILFALVIMIVDGIHPIQMPYHVFMNYMICGILMVYIIAYQMLLKWN